MNQPPPPIFRVVVGTAGHIDHGKSSIVRYLTGVDPDRLPEEKTRGLTIDLGFAPWELPSGERVGLVDVPGHERFVKNMVAGASGIDFVCLVVAADDSVMPQTREHLDIMTLLGVERGCVVINKIDLVEEELLDLVEEEIAELTSGTFLEEAPAFRVSATEQTGMPEFAQKLAELVRGLPSKSASGVFRMPIQRVFSAPGHGTIVTGIPVAGSLCLGDRVEILPIKAEARIRGIQAYRQTVDRASAGHSSALNLSDVDYQDLDRGMVVSVPDYFETSTMIEARIRVLDHLPAPLKHRMPVRFHTGTAEVLGRLYLLEEKSLAPGSEGYAQFRFEEPVVVAPRDRFVFRQETPLLTLGGGEVLDRSKHRLKVGKEFVIERLRQKERALESVQEFLVSLLGEDPYQIFDTPQIARRLGVDEERAAELVSELTEEGVLKELANGRWLSVAGLEQAVEKIRATLANSYDQNPFRVTVPKPELRARTKLDADFFEQVVQLMIHEGTLDRHSGGRLSEPGHEAQLTGRAAEAYDFLAAHFDDQLLSPKKLSELASSSPFDQKLLENIQSLLLDEGRVVRVGGELILGKNALNEAKQRLHTLFTEVGAFSASQAKDALETSRKYAIPILEQLDAEGFTQRVGDQREIPGSG